jgi:hypothetical protein
MELRIVEGDLLDQDVGVPERASYRERNMTMQRATRRGFTWLELGVCLIIILVLVGLLSRGVHKVRIAAARTSDL